MGWLEPPPQGTDSSVGAAAAEEEGRAWWSGTAMNLAWYWAVGYCTVPLGQPLHVCPPLTGKNKRVGKQLASQKILQLLHPHVKNWGSLLRMYGRESSKMVKQVTDAFLSSATTSVL